MTISIILAFFFGVLACFGGLSVLWGSFLILLTAALVIRAWPQHRRHFFLCLFAFVFGIGFASLRIHWQRQHVYPSFDEQHPVLLHGLVSGLPYHDATGTHFTLSVNQPPIHGKLALISRSGDIRAGEGVRCQVVANREHGLVNPGGMDEDALAFANDFIAYGSAEHCQPTGEQHFVLRAWMQARLKPCLPHTQKSAWLMALLLGERVNLDPADWQVLRNTGTNHLMAIGGLHLGMLALWVSFMVAWLWRPQPIVQGVLSWMACWMYAGLSGFSIPTERAFLMLTVVVITLSLRRKSMAWQSLGLALLFVVLLNPATVILQGFWFSFLAIVWIGLTQQGRPYMTRSRLRLALRLQGMLTLGLLPLCVYDFQSFQGVTLLANAIAIPWLWLFILPFCLLALLCVPWCAWLTTQFLQLAGWGLDGLWKVLFALSHATLFSFHVAAPSLFAVILASIGVLVMILPRGTPGKPLSVLCLLPLLMTHSYALPLNHYRVAVLDVGQGLSCVVRTRNHVLVYDAGGRLSPQRDEGERVVLPYLTSLGVTQFDTLMISHGDNDHAGGADAVLNALPVQRVLTSVPTRFPGDKTQPCLAGSRWQWDGVTFTILAPASADLQGNNGSCVLMIDNGHVRTLLPGDVEAEGERALLASWGAHLNADLLIAPHHGSDTSSTLAFREAVHPSVVVYSTGYHNHYHLPSSSVMSAYAKAGVQAFDTVNEGALVFEAGDALSVVHRERADKKVWRI